MGIRAAWKEDLGATAAAMICGESVRLLGNFFFASTGYTKLALRN